MCTVTYLPLKDSILFSSNRDEDPQRKRASPPEIHPVRNRRLLFPKDTASGGTWIGLNETGTIVIALNGGFAKHERKPAYRHSRGIIVTSMLEHADPADYWNGCNLENIEPFSLVAFAHKKLYHFVWTGMEKHAIEPDPSQPHIWSSSTLYDITAKNKRIHLFQLFLESGIQKNKQSVLDFLCNAAKNDTINGFIINRNEKVKTCSISLVEMHSKKAEYEYHDLLGGTRYQSVLHFTHNKRQPLRFSYGLP